ncbi:hypothetical protein [Streptomyces sp. NPDC127040]|uniref:hypothetical protein n=1 Tax=Streptomyces sp. NPDC127040 TaxID=3347116 RepID=UPI003663ADB2
MTPTTTVLSVLLSDLPPVIEAPALLRGADADARPVDPDYEATDEAGYIETDEAFALRIQRGTR